MDFTKGYIMYTMTEEDQWKPGDSDEFTYGGWNLKLEREDYYSPFRFSVTGERIGTKETLERYYSSMEDAFLYILNEFNENADVKNRYETLEQAMEEWDDTPKKYCKTCGRKINESDGDIAFHVNPGTPAEYVECELCHDSAWENGRIINCENCGRWFSEEQLCDEEVCGDTFLACPNCGKDMVEGITREEFEADHSFGRYAVVVSFGDITRGYQITAKNTVEAMEKLLNRLKETKMTGFNTVEISEIFLDDDVIE